MLSQSNLHLIWHKGVPELTYRSSDMLQLEHYYSISQGAYIIKIEAIVRCVSGGELNLPNRITNATIAIGAISSLRIIYTF